MTIDEAYLWMNFICNKLQSGAISPDEFNLLAQRVNIDMFKLKAGLPEDYQLGQPISRQGWQITNKIHDDASHLLERADLSVDTNGYFVKPADYGAYSSMQYGYVVNQPYVWQKCQPVGPVGAKIRWVPIEIVTDLEMTYRLPSQLIPPTEEQPIGSFDVLGLKVYPEDITMMRLNYLRIPAKPIRNYVPNGDQNTYNPTGSVDFEWPEPIHNDLVIMMCKYVGINLREQELVQLSLQRQQQGV